MIFKPLFIKFFACFVVLIGVFDVSGGGDENYYWMAQNSTFTPELFADKSYEPLFYTSNLFYGDNQFHNDHSNRFLDDQVKEWKNYLNLELTENKIKLIIGTDSLNKPIEQACLAIKALKPISGAKIFNLNNDKIKQFLLFVNLAKSLEFATNNYPDWDYDSQTLKPANKLKASQVKKAENLYLSTKDPFLKNKYWFLTMKAHFYATDFNKTLAFFEKTSNSIEKNTNYFRALAYVAGTNYKLKNFALANYQYAQVFDACPVLRPEAIRSFKPQENKDFQAALALSTNNSEKCALWALFGYFADAQEAIKNIYDIDAKNQHLDFLLTRAVNIEENKLNEQEYQKYTNNTTIKNEKLDENLFQLVSKIANNNNTTKPFMWQMVLGYFETLKGNFKAAETQLNLAKKNASQGKEMLNQIKLFEVFNELARTKILNPDTEAKLLPSIKWLFELEKTNQNQDYYNTTSEENVLRTSFLVNWTRTYLSTIYKNQKNFVMAEIWAREKNFYLNKDSCKKMESYFVSSNKTAWQLFAEANYEVTQNDLYEFKAITLAYQNKIDEAIIEMRKSTISNDFLLGNPFNGKIKDCNDCDHAAKQKTKYTKLSFLEKIKEIETNVAKGTEQFSGLILLGNAHYNMSYYGNARYFYNNKIIDQYNTNYIDEEYNEMFSNNNFSEIYYKTALTAAQNNEEKAKATYLLTKIERNNFYGTEKHKPYEIDFILFQGYKNLINNYANTKYYQEVIKECGYFARVAP